MTKEEWINAAFHHLCTRNIQVMETITRSMSKEESMDFVEQLYDSLTTEQLNEDIKDTVDIELSYLND